MPSPSPRSPFELVVVGVVAGFLAGISPCILPVLPVVLVAGAEPVENAEQAPDGPARRRASLGRPLAVIAGLVLSFSFIVLAGSTALSLLHLPQDFLRNAGIVVLIVVGLGYLIPSLGTLLERPFARLSTRRPGTGAGTLGVTVNGHHTQTLDIGTVPRLYTLYRAGSAANGTLLLHASPGVQAYDFTFG